MQFLPLNQIQLGQMEPVDQLAPYLNGLDVDDAVQSFGQLADQLLQQQQHQQQQPDLSTAQPVYPETEYLQSSKNNHCYWPSSQQQYLCEASSPAPSDQSISATSSSYFSWSSASSGRSSRPASVASSCDLSDERRQRNRRRCSRDSTSNNLSRELRQKNASAAEKYRRRLKGREWSLAQEMEREQVRNARLRSSLEAKLALYKEFVALLAVNTCDKDIELAQLGSRSLSAVVGELFSDISWLKNERSEPKTASSFIDNDNDDQTQIHQDEVELRQQLERFQQILRQTFNGNNNNNNSGRQVVWPHRIITHDDNINHNICIQ